MNKNKIEFLEKLHNGFLIALGVEPKKEQKFIVKNFTKNILLFFNINRQPLMI